VWDRITEGRRSCLRWGISLNKSILVGCGLALAFSGCASSPSTTSELMQTSEFATMGDPLEVAWSMWTRSNRAPLPENFVKGWSAFDYALVQDSADVEVAWAAVHGVLNLLQTGDGELQAMLMTELEPGGEPGLDLSFVVLNAEPSKEGILGRWSQETKQGLTPQVSILIARNAGEAGPMEITMWMHSDAEENPGETVTLRRSEGWSMFRQVGISESATKPGEVSREATIAAGVLIDAIWRPFSDVNYIEKVSASQKDRVGVEPAHAGLPKADRQIGQVLSDTQFPPRFEFR